MKLALIGYGKMGHIIEDAAARAGHEVVCVRDLIVNRGRLEDAEVSLDFSEPAAVIDNLQVAATAGTAVVIGTTGWYSRLDEARAIVESRGIGCVYGSNFSIGVNLFFHIAREAARLAIRFEAYDPFLEEAHHKFKKDAPSGTALVLKRIVEGEYRREPPVTSVRAGYFPGTHVVGFDSPADTIELTHRARDRSGFAEGAVAAAEWIRARKGFYEFSQVIEERLGRTGER